MNGLKRWTALLATAAAMLTFCGCKTTVVNRDVPQHDDHRDDHRQPPPPDRH